MQADVFIRRRNNALIFFALLTILTAGSIIITQYDVLKGFTSFVKAFTWGASNFYPDVGSLMKLPDILVKLWETVLMSIAATTVAAILSLFLAVAGSRTTRTA